MDKTEIKRSKHQKPESRLVKECNTPECPSYTLSMCRKEDFDNCYYMKCLIAAHTMKID
jgi:hypothetical protein